MSVSDSDSSSSSYGADHKSLKQVSRERLLHEMLRSAKTGDSKSTWKVLIMDKLTVKIMSHSCKMADITDEGVKNNTNVDRVSVEVRMLYTSARVTTAVAPPRLIMQMQIKIKFGENRSRVTRPVPVAREVHGKSNVVYQNVTYNSKQHSIHNRLIRLNSNMSRKNLRKQDSKSKSKKGDGILKY